GRGDGGRDGCRGEPGLRPPAGLLPATSGATSRGGGRLGGGGGSAVNDRAPRTLLLAEDDNSLRNLAREVLEGDGYRVLAAERGEEALRLAAAHDGVIDLLLTDLIMPGI